MTAASSVTTASEQGRDKLKRAIAAMGLPPEWRVRIEYRRRRTTLGIEVKAGGTVVLAVPDSAEPEVVAATFGSQLDRVARAVARRSATVADHPAKELVDGEHFDYLGRTYRLRIQPGNPPDVGLVEDWLELTTRPGVGPDSAQLIDWYTRRGEEWVGNILPALARAAGISPPAIRIRSLGGRWGLRESDGTVAIHWAVFQLPPPLIELVVAHELTHLRVAKHSPEFRRELNKLIPDRVARERLLVDVGSSVWLGALRNVRT